jgi:heat shock protein HtpX
MLKSTLLIISLPVVLRWVLVVLNYLASQNNYWASLTWWDAIVATNELFVRLWPIILIRWLIAFFFQRQIIFAFSGAHPVTRKDYPEIYNIVENLCISQWLSVPKIGIIQDESLNAFALGWDMDHARIVFTAWLLKKLNKREIEAVAAHELTHIINKDSLLMVMIVVYIGIIATLWEILIRSARSWSKKGNILPLVGIILLLLGYIFYPLIRMALSRKREFLADAWSVMITKDAEAMIGALKKISSNPEVMSIKKDTVAALCIENPLKKWTSRFSNLLATHPPVEERIRALQSY